MRVGADWQKSPIGDKAFAQPRGDTDCCWFEVAEHIVSEGIALHGTCSALLIITMPPDARPAVRKLELAEEVERILKRLRKELFPEKAEIHLPPIDPEQHALWNRKCARAKAGAPGAKPQPTAAARRLFPSHADLYELDCAVEKLAREIGVRRSRFQDRQRMHRRVEHDYRRLDLKMFAGDLASRVAAVPEPPLTRLAKALAVKLSDSDRKAARELYLLLGGNPHHLGEHYQPPGFTPQLQWKGFSGWLAKLVSPSFTKAQSSSTGFGDQSLLQLAFADVLCQQLLWRSHYGADMEPAVQWLYSLLDPEIDRQLRVVLHGVALSPEQARAAFTKSAGRFRQRAYRAREKTAD